jgi:hypothetical protein
MHRYLVIYSYVSTGRTFVNEFHGKMAALKFYNNFAKAKEIAVHVGEYNVLKKNDISKWDDDPKFTWRSSGRCRRLLPSPQQWREYNYPGPPPRDL